LDGNGPGARIEFPLRNFWRQGSEIKKSLGPSL
jgi:hypothetical protein